MSKFTINEELLAQIESLQSILKNNVAGMFGGNRQSKSFGSSCEFADYRDYLPGDDINKIDWNAYARFDKLYEKLYYDERQMHTRIYIDASRSMVHGSDEKAESIITGIAGKKDFTVLCIEKSRMNSEVGFIRKVLSVIEHFNICVEHLPSGIDTLSIVMESEQLKHGVLDDLVNEIIAYMSMGNHVSTTKIQTKFNIGYPRAARIIERLSEANIIYRDPQTKQWALNENTLDTDEDE